ncbi:MAG: ABC transporter ATP-binding protein [Pseudoflavonifractor sp.]|nr:ABC transporter ATP-binding protein [Pseudoflavonifractor sp.]
MIQVRDINKSYGALHVLRDISLDISRGEIMSIVGPSGAGKTTLLQIIGSLDRPDSGRVLYDGTDILTMRDSALARFRNRNIGFIFQFHQLLPEFTVEENVAMPALIGGDSRHDAMKRARRLIDYLGIASRAGHKPSELSGGERQRAAVARALVNNPRVILADEPSGSLDSHNRAELHRLFFDLRRDMGQTFVIVTHDESLAADTDRIVHMNDGRITGIVANRAQAEEVTP